MGLFAKLIAERATAPIKREVERHALDLKQKATSYGIGAALAAGAAIVALLGLGFAFASAAVALALVMPLWAALLVVTAVLFVIAGILGAVAAHRLRR